MEINKLIKEYLEEAKMMQLATSAGDQPWCCTLYFAFDEELNLYWLSLPATRHSQELRSNPKVAGVIVLPHSPGDKVRGLQFEGIAEEINDEASIRNLAPHYEKRFEYEIAEDIISGKNEHKLYQIKPSQFVLFDQLNFPDNPRQEYTI